MGFGSYDESEQENQEINTDEGETGGVAIHDSDHDGEVSFERGASTDELVGRLADIKTDEADED
ncbi:death domain-associated protein [Halobacteriales archaeon SW_10_68_16]|jgi:hypothetical protein|nr:MAG: death domain-associated protein [Halobacteriales archaeon SW_10_68_16]